MDGDQGAYLLYLLLAMVLVGSALVSRKLPGGRTMKMALAWIAIFAVVILLMSLLVEP